MSCLFKTCEQNMKIPLHYIKDNGIIILEYIKDNGIIIYRTYKGNEHEGGNMIPLAKI